MDSLLELYIYIKPFEHSSSQKRSIFYENESIGGYHPEKGSL